MSDKEYVIRKCEKQFSKQQNLTILELLREMNATVVECADGSRVNLDALSAIQITRLKRKADTIVSELPDKYRIWT
jgi:hypothetical protein